MLDYSACNQCGNGVCDAGETNSNCAADCPTMAGSCPVPTVWNDLSDLCEPAAICTGPFYDGAGNCMMAGGSTVGPCACCNGLDGSSGTCQIPQCGSSATIQGWLPAPVATNGRQCSVAVATPPVNGYYCHNPKPGDTRSENTAAITTDGWCCPSGTYWDGSLCQSSAECSQNIVTACGPKATSFSSLVYLAFMGDPICVGDAAVGDKPAGLSACSNVAPKNGKTPFMDWTDWVGQLIGATLY